MEALILKISADEESRSAGFEAPDQRRPSTTDTDRPHDEFLARIDN